VDPRTNPCLRERLKANSRAPQIARRSLERALCGLSPALLYRLKLLVSELVTNAVIHGPQAKGGAIQLTVMTSQDAVSVAVTDSGSGFDRTLRAPSIRDSGWGLFLVEKLSDRWGVAREKQTRVWFEIDRQVEENAWSSS
jgi:anti-sigma regulatory factor (Ser/Thr protein kinase)